MQRATCKWEGEREQARLTQRLWYRRQFGCSLLCTLSLLLSSAPVIFAVLRSALIDAAGGCAAWWQLCDLFGTFSMKIICGSRAYWKANNYSFFSSATGVTLAKLYTYTCAEYLLTYVCVWMQLRKQSQENVHRTKTATMLMLTYINILCTKGFVRDSGRS